MRTSPPAGLVGLALVLAACASQPPAPPPAPDDPPVSTTSAGARGLTRIAAFEVGESVTHPSGVQLRVDRVELFEEATVVEVGLTNGSLFGIRLDQGVTELRAVDGQVAELTDPIAVERIPPGEDVDLGLRFGPLTHPEALTLVVNQGGGSSPTSPSTSSPSFAVSSFPLDPGRGRPQLPAPAFVERSVVHPNGVELQVGGLSFTPTRIGMWVRVANPAPFDITVAARTIAPSLVADDLGNVYPLMLPDDETALRVVSGTARAGVLAFAGRIHPDATSLTLGLNQRADATTESRGAEYPRFLVEDISLAGERRVPLPAPLEAGAETVHPNGTTARVGGMRFGSSSIEADVTLTNRGSRAVGLGRDSAVVDDLGNRYPLLPPPDEPQLRLEPGTGVEATFVFSGQVAAGAREVSVRLNPGGSSDDPDTANPSLALGPFPLQRPPAGPAPEPRLFPVASTSYLYDELLVASDVEQVVQTLVQFGATEVEGGIQLTLPDDVLFDFASAELREDAQSALALIAEVLEYFEGDLVTVVGHTDSIGSATQNQRLSEARAESVVEALVSRHGVEADRLRAEGRGASEPVAPNTTPDGADDPAGRQLNRRVEIVVATDKPIPTG